MPTKFRPKEVPRLAVDGIYVQKNAFYEIKGVEAYVAPDEHPKPPQTVASAKWRDKGEHLYMPMEHAAYVSKPEYKRQQKDMPDSAAPRFDDPLTRYQLSYLNGGGGSGKTTRSIELFRQRDPFVFTPTHRLAKEMRTRAGKAQTYHSFFRWSGQTEWTPEIMGQKLIHSVIIWDEICTMTQPTHETFLDWLEHRGGQAVCCGD